MGLTLTFLAERGCKVSKKKVDFQPFVKYSGVLNSRTESCSLLGGKL